MSIRQVAGAFLLSLGCGLVPGVATSQMIIGRLIDGETMQPVRGGIIRLLDSAAVVVGGATSDSLGRFRIHPVDPGVFRVQVEALSYHSMEDGPVVMGPADTVGVEFFVLPAPESLDPIVVEAERTRRHLRMAGFYRREAREMGQFLTREEIEEIRPFDLPGLLAEGALGVFLRPNSAGALMAAFPAGRSSTGSGGGGFCTPMYFLDGFPLAIEPDAPTFPVHPNDVAAVEVYSTQAETPVQFRDPRAGCGVVVIWTR